MVERIRKQTLATAFAESDESETPSTLTKSELADQPLIDRRSHSVAYWNVCSLKCPLTQTFIAGECEIYCIDILCVSETWLSGNLEDELVSTPGGKSKFHFSTLDLTTALVLWGSVSSSVLEQQNS